MNLTVAIHPIGAIVGAFLEGACHDKMAVNTRFGRLGVSREDEAQLKNSGLDSCTEYILQHLSIGHRKGLFSCAKHF